MAPTIKANFEILGDGTLSIGGISMNIPQMRVLRELGRGANAVVFEAEDIQLGRRVAIKVWNHRGVQRAQSETKKIASFNHPLIVTTFSYGQVADQPFAVMEMIDGVSVKGWLSEERHIEDRVRIWKLYSQALNFIHSQGKVHGDPHTGNLLVYPDVNALSGQTYGAWAVKIADAGTSEFWPRRADMHNRESKLICETAERLFYDQNLPQLWQMSPIWHHAKLLIVLEVLCSYISAVNGFSDWDRRSMHAGQIVDLIGKAPLFNLDAVLEQIQTTGFTERRRVVSRLNQRFLRLHDLGDSEMILPETREAYSAYRERFVAEKLNNIQEPIQFE